MHHLPWKPPPLFSKGGRGRQLCARMTRSPNWPRQACTRAQVPNAQCQLGGDDIELEAPSVFSVVETQANSVLPLIFLRKRGSMSHEVFAHGEFEMNAEAFGKHVHGAASASPPKSSNATEPRMLAPTAAMLCPQLASEILPSNKTSRGAQEYPATCRGR